MTTNKRILTLNQKIATYNSKIMSWQLPGIVAAVGSGSNFDLFTVYGDSTSTLQKSTWPTSVPGLPIIYSINNAVYALAIDFLVGGTQSKLWKSTDKGASFSYLKVFDNKNYTTIEYFNDFTTDNNGNYLIAQNNRVFKSTDGENWTITGTFSNTIEKIIYCKNAPTINGLTNYFYIMTSSNSEHYTSFDGSGFTLHLPSLPNNYVDMVFCEDFGTFVRIGTQTNFFSSKVSYSTDGTNYSNSGGSGGFEQYATICYSPQKQLLVGVQFGPGANYEVPKIITSTDGGVNITKHSTAPSELNGSFKMQPAQITWLPENNIFTLQHREKLWTSTNGINWTESFNLATIGSGTFNNANRQGSIILEI
jgi:hypothetical protein